MKTYILNSAVIIFVFLFACQPKENKAPQEGIVEISTRELLPDVHFNGALVGFADKQYAESARHIGLAIQYMDTILLTIEDSTRKQIIRNSISELIELKEHVAVAKVDGIQDLNYFFARAGNSLAGLHMNVAKTEYFKLDGIKAGGELDKALRAVENALKYHHLDLTKEEQELIARLRKNADRLKIGEKIPTGEMEELFDQLNTSITKLSSDIEINYASYKNKRKTTIHDKPS
ncbi:MAG: hypothetical protein LW721_14830 [Flammeovirgaceae bacterium]|jgi:hypothetical protein|nr:hypothetical protein [Flammeovirgaceae bacterium]